MVHLVSAPASNAICTALAGNGGTAVSAMLFARLLPAFPDCAKRWRLKDIRGAIHRRFSPLPASQLRNRILTVIGDICTSWEMRLPRPSSETSHSKA
jgi:hypothetical protein